MKKIFITGGSGFIGMNLVTELDRLGYHILNYDITAPQIEEHRKFWVNGDLMDAELLLKVVQEFSPNWAIHLAGRTDCDENTTVEQGYRSNTIGTKNFLAAIAHCESLERTIVTSSQYVCGPGRLPESDEDYFPATVYGMSKVEAEKLTRSSGLPGTWTLIRPVNIWGPYHARYCREFWRIASLGLYLHPSVPSPVRTYGYVGNVVWQIIRILSAQATDVHAKVFYAGDRPISIDQWSLEFNRQLSGREAFRVPLWLMKMLAKTGDAISFFTRRPFLLTSSRLKSMTMDYIAPMDETFELFGDPPYSLEEGIKETVLWFRAHTNNSAK